MEHINLESYDSILLKSLLPLPIVEYSNFVKNCPDTTKFFYAESSLVHFPIHVVFQYRSTKLTKATMKDSDTWKLKEAISQIKQKWHLLKKTCEEGKKELLANVEKKAK